MYKVVTSVKKNLQTDYPVKKDAWHWILFPGNTGPYPGTDESHPFQLGTFTILTGKARRGRKGALIVMREEMEDHKVIAVINCFQEKERLLVKDVTSVIADVDMK